MCSSVTLPSGANSSRRAGASAASRSRGPRPSPPAIARSFSRSRRVTSMESVADAGNVHRPAVVERREIELQLRVLDSVGGQHVRPPRRHAPLEALAHVPPFAAVRSPGRGKAREGGAYVDGEGPPPELVGAPG